MVDRVRVRAGRPSVVAVAADGLQTELDRAQRVVAAIDAAAAETQEAGDHEDQR